MKIFVSLFPLLILLLLPQKQVFAEITKTANEPATLRWVGCGISKKAYLTELAAAYEKKTGVHIDIQGGGATRGIRDVAAGSADMGGSCRRRMRGASEESGVTMVPVAWDALVIIVNKENPVNSISIDALRKVYRGEITNWKELGGPDQPIKLFARQGKISGVGRTARKLLFDNYEQEFAATELFPSSGPLEKKIEVDVDALGISGVSSARKRNVKILVLNGKSPSYDNVAHGDYLLYRPLYLAFNQNAPNADLAREFIKFADTPEGMEVIRSNGTVPYLEGLHLMKKKIQESRMARKNKGLQ